MDSGHPAHSPARPFPPVHTNRHHYTSKHSRKSTARAAPAQKYPGYNRAQASAAAEPYGWFYMCSSLQGSSAYARAAYFFAGPPRGGFCACTRQVFFLILCTVFFRGGRETASSEALFLSLPAPSLSSSTVGLPRCFAHGLIFRCSSLRGSSAYARAACFFAGLRRAVSAPAHGSAAVCKLRGSGQFTNGYQISRLKNNNLPMAKFYFAVYQT